MSRIRGVFPLFLATAFGIVNGIWVFGPAFKEQQEWKDVQAMNALDRTPQPPDKEIDTLSDLKAELDQSKTPEPVSNSDGTSSS